MKKDFMFTSESVTEGHPDKLCDLIADAIVDEFLIQDPFARVRAELAAAKGILFLATRFASTARVDVADAARRVIDRVGYDKGEFSARDCTIIASLSERPPAKPDLVDEGRLTDAEVEALKASNQVTVFGFACTQTPNLMPAPIDLAHRLARAMDRARHDGDLPYLGPDGKTQVGVEYRGGRPARIHSITLLASQRKGEETSAQRLRDDLVQRVPEPVFADAELRPDGDTRLAINPEGPITGGGPSLHAGLTGRKTAVDTYGEYARHSGAALSGKDPLRIDRVGAYAARYAAKNIVAAGLAQVCEVQLSYAIGLADPVSVQLETYGTGTLDDDTIAQRLAAHLDLRLGGIVRTFHLRHIPGLRPPGFFQRLAVYGHMGREDLDPPWEKTDLAERLR